MFIKSNPLSTLMSVLLGQPVERSPKTPIISTMRATCSTKRKRKVSKKKIQKASRKVNR